MNMCNQNILPVYMPGATLKVGLWLVWCGKKCMGGLVVSALLTVIKEKAFRRL
jgi:hypothetical protein